MDDSSENLQEKLAHLSEHLDNSSPTVDQARDIKAAIQDIIERLDALQSPKR